MSWRRNVNSISCSHGKWWAPHCLELRIAAIAVPKAAHRNAHRHHAHCGEISVSTYTAKQLLYDVAFIILPGKTVKQNPQRN